MQPESTGRKSMSRVVVLQVRARSRAWMSKRVAWTVPLALLSLVGFLGPPAVFAGTAGAVLWTSRFDGPASGKDTPAAVAVNPGGSVVYETGTVATSGEGDQVE